MMEIVKITVEPVRRVGRHGIGSALPAPATGNTNVMYRVWLGDEILLDAARTPFFSAARELLERGYSPAAVLEMRHQGSQTVALRGLVGKAARYTVVENEDLGPDIVPYVPLTPEAIARLKAYERKSTT